jgi:trehalose 6-phosphate phosphatase
MVALAKEIQQISYSFATSAVANKGLGVSGLNKAGAVLAEPEKWALFIDIDGTLLGVAPTPDAVMVPAGLVQLLDGLANGLGGALAILTGRRVADADRLFAPLKLVASGVHGTELRSEPGGPITTLAPAIPSDVIGAMNNIAGIASGILVEQKGCGVAVHYRNAPLARQALETELAAIIASSSYDLVLRKGRKVLEAVPSGYSKGTALAALLARPPFKGRSPVMVGDDVGDESAFIAAERLGGMALRVAGEHFDKREADFDGVADVHAWLKALAGRLALQGVPRGQSTPVG